MRNKPRQRSLVLSGFRDVPNGFIIDRYTIGQDHWIEGYVTVTHADLLREYKEKAKEA
jgi:hypothetical protein